MTDNLTADVILDPSLVPEALGSARETDVCSVAAALDRSTRNEMAMAKPLLSPLLGMALRGSSKSRLDGDGDIEHVETAWLMNAANRR